jgi:plastocyanin
MRALKLIAAVMVVALALSGAVAAAANAPSKPSTTPKSKSKPKEVTVNDYYFSPEKVTIAKGGSVKWVWSESNTAPHDVHLKSGPKGLKEKAKYSTKTTAVTDAEFEKEFPMPGTYHFICTIHPTMMHMTVIVKK